MTDSWPGGGEPAGAGLGWPASFDGDPHEPAARPPASVAAGSGRLAPAGHGRHPAAAGHQRGGAAREVRQGRRAQPGRGPGAGGPGAGRGGVAGAARALGGEVPRGAAARLRAGGADRLGGGHGLVGHPDQLLRPAGGRCDRRGRGRPPRHLHRADRSGGDDAARRRGGLRLLADPAAGRVREVDAVERIRPDQLHAGVRPQLRDGGVGRLAARCADGRAALRPPGHRGLHPCEGPGRPEELQHLGGRDRRVHGGGRGRCRHRAGAQGRARRQAARRRRDAARRRAVGLPPDAGPQAVGPGHALHLRPRRAGRALPGPDQCGQQPALLRVDQRDESVRDRGDLGADGGRTAPGGGPDRDAVPGDRRWQGVSDGIGGLLPDRDEAGARAEDPGRPRAAADGESLGQESAEAARRRRGPGLDCCGRAPTG